MQASFWSSERLYGLFCSQLPPLNFAPPLASPSQGKKFQEVGLGEQWMLKNAVTCPSIKVSTKMLQQADCGETSYFNCHTVINRTPYFLIYTGLTVNQVYLLCRNAEKASGKN